MHPQPQTPPGLSSPTGWHKEGITKALPEWAAKEQGKATSPLCPMAQIPDSWLHNHGQRDTPAVAEAAVIARSPSKGEVGVSGKTSHRKEARVEAHEEASATCG